jgi:predicted GNAT family N-acyltransferase
MNTLVTIERMTGVADPRFIECAACRIAVFTQEQGFSIALEFDQLDVTATHFLASVAGSRAGTVRMNVSPEEAEVVIGRLVCIKEKRGLGVGGRLMTAAMAHAAATCPGCSVVLSAQQDKVAFYEKLGFKCVSPGEPYMDEGVPHLKMKLQPLS